ncbi:MAG: hypothetical protein IJV27_07835 [Prevotella sp.]|nr:hypothetical protein [Prevotella sp.]
MKKIIPFVITALLTISACEDDLKDDIKVDQDDNIVLEEDFVEIIKVDSDSLYFPYANK